MFNPLLSLEHRTDRPADMPIVLPNYWGNALPEELDEFYASYRDGAGWIGESYLELFDLQFMLEINVDRARVDPMMCRYLMFGTTGGGEDFGVAWTSAGFVTYAIPTIGCSSDVIRIGSMSDFFEKLTLGTYLNGEWERQNY